MKFRELIESPVGSPGRTGTKDAQNYISDDLIKQFDAIVKKLGGKTVAKQILGGYKPPKPETTKDTLPQDIDKDFGVPQNTLKESTVIRFDKAKNDSEIIKRLKLIRDAKIDGMIGAEFNTDILINDKDKEKAEKVLQKSDYNFKIL